CSNAFDEGGWLGHGIGDRKNLVTRIGYKNAVLPLGRQAMVAGDHRPAVGQGADILASGIDHGLDGEDHSGLEFLARAGPAIVQNLRVLVELAADSVAAIFAHDRKTLLFGVFLDGVPDVAQRGAGAHLLDAQPHAFVGGFGEAARQDGRLAHVVHAAGIAEPAVLDDGDVDVHDVAVLEDLVAGNAVADDVVYRSADGSRKGRIAGRGIAHGSRFNLELVGDEIHAEL